MKKYEILEHPAELRLRIYGKTVEELFINAAAGLSHTQKRDITLIKRSRMKCNKGLGRKKIKEKIKKEKMETSSIDINSLLVDFLSEILAKSQINKCVYFVRDINIRMSDVHRTSDIPEVQPPQIDGRRRRSREARLEAEPHKVEENALVSPTLRTSEVPKLKVGLKAELVGVPIKRFDEDIKAVTYEDLDIKKIKSKVKDQKSKVDLWQTDLVLDI